MQTSIIWLVLLSTFFMHDAVMGNNACSWSWLKYINYLVSDDLDNLSLNKVCPDHAYCCFSNCAFTSCQFWEFIVFIIIYFILPMLITIFLVILFICCYCPRCGLYERNQASRRRKKSQKVLYTDPTLTFKLSCLDQ